MNSKEAKNAAEDILRYYMPNRRRGHTTAMLNGGANSDCLIFAANRQHARMLAKLAPKAKIVGPQAILIGCRKPLLIDHSALEIILHSLTARITDLERVLVKTKQALSEQIGILDSY